MVSAFEIFLRAERIERDAAALYRRLLDSFPWPESDRDVLKRLEQEEIQHAARIRLLTAQYRNDGRLFQVPRASLERLAAIDVAWQQFVAELDEGRWGEDLEALKRRIGDLEERCGASHAEVLADCADPRVADFFRELGRQDDEHRAILLGGPLPERLRDL